MVLFWPTRNSMVSPATSAPWNVTGTTNCKPEVTPACCAESTVIPFFTICKNMEVPFATTVAVALTAYCPVAPIVATLPAMLIAPMAVPAARFTRCAIGCAVCQAVEVTGVMLW